MLVINIRYLMLILSCGLYASTLQQMLSKEASGENIAFSIMLQSDDQFIPYRIVCGVEEEIAVFIKSILDECDKNTNEVIDVQENVSII